MENVVKGSFDRLEGKFAVIYSDVDNRKFDVSKSMVVGIKSGSRVLLHLNDDGTVIRIEVDAKSTQDALDRIKKKYERLRKGKHIRN